MDIPFSHNSTTNMDRVASGTRNTLWLCRICSLHRFTTTSWKAISCEQMPGGRKCFWWYVLGLLLLTWLLTRYAENVTDFVSLNPSLSYDDKEPTECELKKGYRYCIRKTPRSRATSLSSRTTTGSGTSVVASTEASQSQASASMTTSTGSNGVPTPLPIQVLYSTD